jgi:FtsP/CotA-like multicopper oxidase with cupredoxin domain
MTFFDVRVPGLQMTVVQADGNDVEPVTVDEFRIGVADPRFVFGLRLWY